MAKTRGAAEKKPAKKAAKKAAPAKSSGRATAAKSAGRAANGKASSKSSASKPAAKTAKVAKAASKAPARKASAAPAPKPAKAAKPAPDRAKAVPEPAPAVTKKTSAEREVPAAPPAPPPARAESSGVEQLDDEARARALSEGVSAHPDAQLTPDEVALLYGKLVAERERVLAGHDRHLSEALADSTVMPDETDMAQRSTEQAYLIRFADKERKLLTEIEHALEKMRAGEYGVCEGTDEPIGFKRLELRPWTRYSVGYKEQMERERSQHRR